MKITDGKVVTFHYRLAEQGGQEIENNYDSTPMSYLHGRGNLLSALENALHGLEPAAKTVVTLTPEQAYGNRVEDAERRVSIKHLVGKYKRLLPGMLVRVNAEQGVATARVIKAGKFNVDLDLNHPFAGMTLVFDIEIKEVRDATDEELSHGHAHGVGGHHH